MSDTNYRSLIMVRMGELTLKGLNRGRFERQLVNNISRRLAAMGDFKVRQTHSRIFVEAAGDSPLPEDPGALLQAITNV
ncbi:MAG: hypothetical protein PHP94_09445, partial [Eubacteriales bacterium]|nr:hypothetical protein [Eubacteriales bacterium]